jgi:iron complex outermembrane receptor protein
MTKYFVTASVAALLIGAPAYAQQVVEEEEIVVTAPIEGAAIESLQGANILRRDEIVATLNGGLGDTLDAQPGIASTSFGAGASRPIIRGLGEDRVRVLQNGIGAIDASTASPDHAVTADGLDAERIEVLRGAAALAYGGNAIGGVVNVIDQSIPTRRIEGVDGNVLAAYSTVDDGVQGAANMGFGAGPFAARVSISARDTDPYDTPLGEALNQWTELRSYAAGAGLAGEWGHAGLAIKRTEDNYGLLPEGAGEPGGHIEMEQTRIEARGDFRIDWGAFDRIDFGVQHADYEHTEFEGDGAPGTTFFSEGYEARLEAHHGGGQHQGATGVQIIDVDFEAEGDEAFITPSNTQDIGVFLIERWDTGFWGVEGGARFERREITNATLGSRDFDNVSGSLGAFVRPFEHWFFGATVAHTERAPTAIELYANGPHLATETFELGNPLVDQESALSFELSARYTTGPLRFELNLFNIAFADYIALVERGDVWWLDEATDTQGFAPDEFDPSIPADSEILPVFHIIQQDATFTGGEISAAARLFEAAGFTFTADAGLDIVRAEFDAGGHPPRIPPRTLTLGMEAENPHWSGRIEWSDIAEQDRTAAFETPTAGYSLLNASVAFRPFGDRRLQFRLDGRNLTDEIARAHTSFLKEDLPLPGRNLRFTVLSSF